MFRHFLVPLDGSHLAEMALPAALELASRFESKICLLRVVLPTDLVSTTRRAYADMLVDQLSRNRPEAESYLHALHDSLLCRGFKAQIRVVESADPAAAILDVARQIGADTIVMSAHARGDISRWLFGSVADNVLLYATVPVLLIRAASPEKGSAARAREPMPQAEPRVPSRRTGSN